MIFDDIYNCPSISSKKLAKESMTYEWGYDYWKSILTERAMRLFVWKNTGDVPQREIEFALMLNGSCGVTNKYKNTMAVFNGQYSGSPTIYYDMYEDYAVYSPVFSKILKVDKNVAVIRNNNCMNSIIPLVHRYATMLSHTEVSFINTLINGRDSGGIPIASTNAQKIAIENYRNSLFNGKVTSILDPAFSGVQFLSVDKNTTLNIKDLMETRKNLLNSFYEDLGVGVLVNYLSYDDKNIKKLALKGLKESGIDDIIISNLIIEKYDEEDDDEIRNMYKSNFWFIRKRELE